MSAAWHPDGKRISAADKSKGGRVYEHEWLFDFKFSWAPSGRAIYLERIFAARETYGA